MKYPQRQDWWCLNKGSLVKVKARWYLVYVVITLVRRLFLVDDWPEAAFGVRRLLQEPDSDRFPLRGGRNVLLVRRGVVVVVGLFGI